MQHTSLGDGVIPTVLDDSSQALQDVGDAMDVDDSVDEDEDVLHALRDFLGDRCVSSACILCTC